MSPGGRDALFDPPRPGHNGNGSGHGGGAGAGAGAGRRALFSAPPRRRGTVVVECSTCEARTPVPLMQVPLRLTPSLFVPFRSFPHLMCCPAGRHVAWCRLDWSTAV